jgi:hypothetical protein
MLLCIDEQSAVFSKLDGGSRRFVDQLKSSATHVIQRAGPEELYRAVLDTTAWDDEVTCICAADGMAAAVSGWINSGRDLRSVRWTYLSAPVDDGWTIAIGTSEPMADRFEHLRQRVGEVAVPLVRVDVSTDQVPRYGLSAAFGGTAGLWQRMIGRTGSAMDWPRIAIEWAASLREGVPTVASEIVCDREELASSPNFAAVYSRDPFHLFPTSENPSTSSSKLRWSSANLTTRQIGEFLKSRERSALVSEAEINEAVLRNPAAVSVDGWPIQVRRGAVVRVGRGPEVRLLSYGNGS